MSHVWFTGRPPAEDRSAAVSHRVVLVAGMAGTVAAGAMALTAMAPRASADSGASSALQPVVDQLLGAQQDVNDSNAALPFLTAFDQTQLPGYSQNVASTMLSILISEQSFNRFGDVYSPVIPYPWSASGADPQAAATGTNPDYIYNPVPVDPNETYVVTIEPGPGTQNFTFTPATGDLVTGDITPIQSQAGGLLNFTTNPDGSYTIIMSSTPQEGNWIDISGSKLVLIRDAIADWGQPHDDISIQQVGGPTTYTLPVLSDSEISSMLSSIATNLPAVNASGTYLGSFGPLDHLPDNTFTALRPSAEIVGGGATMPGTLQLTSFGHFDLQPDQALIVKVPNIETTYTGFQLMNGLAQTSPYATMQSSLNDTNTFQDSDGYTYYVISSQDPGVANWVNSDGLADGLVDIRFQNVQGDVLGTPVTTQVVDVADVRQYLPADTPTVTPEDYAAIVGQRLFEFDYLQDQTHDMGWVTSNLIYDQIRSAVGADQFYRIFGAQQDVASILDRMTDPALVPGISTLADDFAADPNAALSAIVHNLPLAAQDIEMPWVVAMLRLDVDAAQTAQAVDSAISSGDWSQAWSALDTGMQGLATVFSEAWTDPATGIIAGLLNARDDLAVSVMNADSYSPLVADDLTSLGTEFSHLNESVLQMLSGGFSSMIADMT